MPSLLDHLKQVVLLKLANQSLSTDLERVSACDTFIAGSNRLISAETSKITRASRRARCTSTEIPGKTWTF